MNIGHSWSLPRRLTDQVSQGLYVVSDLRGGIFHSLHQIQATLHFKIHLGTERNRDNYRKLGKLIFCVPSDTFLLKCLRIPYKIYKVSLKKSLLKTVLGWMKRGNIVQAILCKREKKKYLCWDAPLGYLPQDIAFSRARMGCESLHLRSFHISWELCLWFYVN